MGWSISCRLCGLVIRDDDNVVEIGGSDPPVAHVACAEAAHDPGVDWEHVEARTYIEWARGIGWGSSAG